MEEPVGTLPAHPLEDLTMPNEIKLPDAKAFTREQGNYFLHMVEAYVDDYIQLAQSEDPEVFWHCSRALLHGLHSTFPSPNITGHDGEDPVSMKKLLKGEGLWEVRNGILGWVFDGATRCIELAGKKEKTILRGLKTIPRMRRDVLFKRLQKMVEKPCHTFGMRNTVRG